MLSGENPFYAKTTSAILKKIVNFTPPLIDKVRPQTPEKISIICHQMLNKDPIQRYGSLKSILKDFEQLTKNLNSNSVLKYLNNPEKYCEISLESIYPSEEVRGKRKNLSYIYLLLIFIGLIMILIYSIKPMMSKKTVEEAIDTSDKNDFKVVVKDSLQDIAENQEKISIAEKIQSNSSKKEKPLTIEPETVADNSLINNMLKPISITITSDPRAWIMINGDSTGISPIKHEITSVPNRLEITLKTPGFPTITKQITINNDSDYKWHVSLWQEVGYLDILVNPWGEIWIDGDSIDVTPISHPIILAPGSHRLEVRHPLLKIEREKIFIIVGDTLRKSITLAKSP